MGRKKKQAGPQQSHSGKGPSTQNPNKQVTAGAGGMFPSTGLNTPTIVGGSSAAGMGLGVAAAVMTGAATALTGGALGLIAGAGAGVMLGRAYQNKIEQQKEEQKKQQEEEQKKQQEEEQKRNEEKIANELMKKQWAEEEKKQKEKEKQERKEENLLKEMEQQQAKQQREKKKKEEEERERAEKEAYKKWLEEKARKELKEKEEQQRINDAAKKQRKKEEQQQIQKQLEEEKQKQEKEQQRKEEEEQRKRNDPVGFARERATAALRKLLQEMREQGDQHWLEKNKVRQVDGRETKRTVCWIWDRNFNHVRHEVSKQENDDRLRLRFRDAQEFAQNHQRAHLIPHLKPKEHTNHGYCAEVKAADHFMQGGYSIAWDAETGRWKQACPGCARLLEAYGITDLFYPESPPYPPAPM